MAARSSSQDEITLPRRQLRDLAVSMS